MQLIENGMTKKYMKKCSTSLAMKLKLNENNALFHTHQTGINLKT